MKAQTDKLRPDTIRFERVYDVPIEDVWALWTTKEGLEEWFAPEGMHVEIPNLELRVGGAYDHLMTAVGAEQIAYLERLGRPPSARVRGRVIEIVHHRRLHICFDIDFVPGVASYPYNMVVELHPDGGCLRMIVTVDRHPDPEMTRGATLALTTQLQHFDAALAARLTIKQS
jgi:uncharacterized protein YndB with AHSA1/START domain